PSIALTRQAIQLGLDAPTLGKLWSTKQPVIISKPDASGQLRTTTYSLSPDGESIIANEEQPADKLEVAPSTPSTTSTTSTTTASPTSPQTDWEYLPNSIGNRRTYTTTNLGSDWPSLGGSFPQWPSSPPTRNWPSFEFPSGVTPQTSTKTEQDDQGRTVTTTIKSYGTPLFTSSSCDLMPEMRDLLDRGGITDEDISNARAKGEDVIRTRTLPDGRVIKTTVRVNSVPVQVPLPTAPPQTAVLYRAPKETAAAGRQPESSVQGEDKSIENFLAQVSLTPSDLLAQNGEVVKTIVDKDGRVLSAKFVLSTVKGDEQGQGQGPPTK
ncbi:hypothetical protein KR044_011953, partial [Drosophila immigrans]